MRKVYCLFWTRQTPSDTSTSGTRIEWWACRSDVSPSPRSILMIARLHRAHTCIPLARWRPRHRQHLVVRLRPRSVRKQARLFLALGHFIPSLCHKRGSYRYHYLCTPDYLAYVGDAESGSSKHFSPARKDPWLNHEFKPVLLEWRAKVYQQPVLDRDATIMYTRKYAASSKPFPTDTTTPGRLVRPHASRPPRRQHGPALLDFSAQQAFHLQLGDHLVDARHLLGDYNKADDDDPAFGASLLRPLPGTHGHSG